MAVATRSIARCSAIRAAFADGLSNACASSGGILINLDANRTVAGEGSGTGAAFPLANEDGVINYQASRPLSELRTAVNTHFGAGLQTLIVGQKNESDGQTLRLLLSNSISERHRTSRHFPQPQGAQRGDQDENGERDDRHVQQCVEEPPPEEIEQREPDHCNGRRR